jgi:hypothetical protein
MQLFSAQTLASYENFRDTFFTNLQKAVIPKHSQTRANFPEYKNAGCHYLFAIAYTRNMMWQLPTHLTRIVRFWTRIKKVY